MKDFLTRVELHNHLTGDYEKLHLAMAKTGFKRTILASDSVTYDLPTAEYVYSGYDTETAITVKDKVKVIVASIHYNYTVFTVQVADWAAFNLTRH